jgi:[ribosomal protein S5]-alanine N-acetyltransferase
MIPEVIRTDRLVLRPWTFGDVPHVLAYANDEEWGRYLPVPHPYLEADARKFIAAQVLHDRTERFGWAVELDGRAIGGLDLLLLEDEQLGELGYAIARAFWGRGLATEAGRAVIDAAFRGCARLTRMRASADARNLASARVLEKLGLKRERLLRSNDVVRGEPVDEIWCSLLRSDWERSV